MRPGCILALTRMLFFTILMVMRPVAVVKLEFITVGTKAVSMSKKGS